MSRAEEIYLQIDARIENNFGREAAFLSELVKVASDNPPGDCAPTRHGRANCWRAWDSPWKYTRSRRKQSMPPG
jgi:hypothetical protein